MLNKFLIGITGLLLGALTACGMVWYIQTSSQNTPTVFQYIAPKKHVIGFLPYWQLDKASQDYSPYVTTLAYFGVRVNPDGSIQKLLNPQQEEPGWYALDSGKVTPFLDTAQQHNVATSLVIATGDINAINGLVENPTQHANALVQSITPLLQQYGFSDINLDIEYTTQASATARINFTQFVREVKKVAPTNTTLTIEITSTDAIKPNLIDVKAMGDIADYVVMMAYDYHSQDSFVTGPVAPLSGAGTTSEYDVTTAVQKTVALVPNNKLILGIPLYGYEWETIGTTPRFPIIPGTGVLASNARAEELTSSCATCSAQRDTTADEPYLSYFSDDTNTYHMIFYPDSSSTKAKIKLSDTYHLNGIALWALGYEGNTILQPLQNYK